MSAGGVNADIEIQGGLERWVVAVLYADGDGEGLVAPFGRRTVNDALPVVALGGIPLAESEARGQATGADLKGEGRLSAGDLQDEGERRAGLPLRAPACDGERERTAGRKDAECEAPLNGIPRTIRDAHAEGPLAVRGGEARDLADIRRVPDAPIQLVGGKAAQQFPDIGRHTAGDLNLDAHRASDGELAEIAGGQPAEGLRRCAAPTSARREGKGKKGKKENLA